MFIPLVEMEQEYIVKLMAAKPSMSKDEATKLVREMMNEAADTLEQEIPGSTGFIPKQ